MSAYAVVNDIAILTRPTRDRIMLSPNKEYTGILLSDDKIDKLYSCYVNLLVKQYCEDNNVEFVENNLEENNNG